MIDTLFSGDVLTRDVVVNVPVLLAENAPAIFAATVTVFAIALLRGPIVEWWRQASLVAVLVGQALAPLGGRLLRVGVFMLVVAATAGTLRAAYTFDVEYTAQMLDGWAGLGTAPMGGLGYAAHPDVGAAMEAATVEAIDAAQLDEWALPFGFPVFVDFSDFLAALNQASPTGGDFLSYGTGMAPTIDGALPSFEVSVGEFQFTDDIVIEDTADAAQAFDAGEEEPVEEVDL